jgi:L-fucose isomerase-like protein
MRIGVACFARPTFDVPYAQDKARAAMAMVRAGGVEIVGDDQLLMDEAAARARLDMFTDTALDGVLVIQASFSDAVMSRILGETVTVPIVFWAFPEPRTGGRLRLNAFCGINLALHALSRIGRAASTLYGDPDQPLAATALAALLNRAPAVPATRAANDLDPLAGEQVVQALNGQRIGLVGEHQAGFDTCAFDARALADRHGMTVAPITVRDMIDRARAVPVDQVAVTAAETRARLDNLDEMEPEATDKALRSYLALRGWADEAALGGLAVRCWPETFTEYGCAVCGAMARLNQEQIPASCEADVPGAIGSMALQALSGTPALLVDIVDMDDASDTIVLWHCGLAPLDMCDPSVKPKAQIHSNRRKPLLHEFPLKPGVVTFARVSEAFGSSKLVIGTGSMQTAPPSFTGTSGVLRPTAGAAVMCARLLAAGLEHHVSITYGDVRAGLESWAYRIGLPVLDLDAVEDAA